ncbi:MAG: acyl carrier protein [Erysipelotrichaceae bacterium]|nr:acyl carrier protein [Erysipelotrichaceae bacterium]
MNEIIINIIKDNLSLKEEVKENTNLNNLSLDSLSFINILVTIEEVFSVSFTDEELNIDNFNNVSDLVKLVKRKVLENEKDSV